MNPFRLSWLVVPVVLAGCGGAGVGSPVGPTSSAPYYQGTVTISNVSGAFPGSATMVANVVPGYDIGGYIWSPTISGTLSKSGSMAILNDLGTPITGTMQGTFDTNSYSFTFTSGNQTVATGILTKVAGPALGKAHSVPPQGTYSGTLVVMNNGTVRDFGGVASTVGANGNWNAPTSTDGTWIAPGVFSGTFNRFGTVSTTSFSANGSVLTQMNPAPYSFDGTTLVVRVDNVTQQPATCWLTLTRQ